MERIIEKLIFLLTTAHCSKLQIGWKAFTLFVSITGMK